MAQSLARAAKAFGTSQRPQDQARASSATTPKADFSSHRSKRRHWALPTSTWSAASRIARCWPIKGVLGRTKMHNGSVEAPFFLPRIRKKTHHLPTNSKSRNCKPARSQTAQANPGRLFVRRSPLQRSLARRRASSVMACAHYRTWDASSRFALRPIAQPRPASVRQAVARALARPIATKFPLQKASRTKQRSPRPLIKELPLPKPDLVGYLLLPMPPRNPSGKLPL